MKTETEQSFFKKHGLLTFEDLKSIGISKTAIYEFEKRGLRIIRFSRRKVFVKESDLDEFILNQIGT